MRKQDLRELNKTLPKATDVAKHMKRAKLRNYSFGNSVTLEWDLNPRTIRDQIFRIKVGDKEALLSSEELLHYVRFV